ncbi:GPALPP motifs-containing protein 1-like isoform X2 [Dendronephthya gigantea]|uniref:GPALPP motifs-containing protein 1-like isoform X2 n=1 Tax=Dendronephthya gigantea TaxID=151771 RepID=UPI00106A69AA|nr:GPALPP motifs-containing protein 1-like isoform X2 [Dendronephthya gigantea]
MEFGPEPPKHLRKTHNNQTQPATLNVKYDDNINSDSEFVYGPALPPDLVGNVRNNESVVPLSDTILKKDDDNDDDDNDNDDNDDDRLFGPALPPRFNQNSAERQTSLEDDDDQETITIGPKLPTQNEEDEYIKRCKEEIESRAKIKKDELSDNKGTRSKKVEREEWMTELPPELGKNFGLGPRTFRSKEVNLGDRSVWTDTPSQREKKKESSSKPPEQREKTKKEVDMEKYVDEHNKRYRSESLLDLHQDVQRKKKKADGTQSERRPFDRDTDLGFRQLDAKKRKSLIKQSTHLNSKFQNSKHGPTYL